MLRSCTRWVAARTESQSGTRVHSTVAHGGTNTHPYSSIPVHHLLCALLLPFFLFISPCSPTGVHRPRTV